MGPSEYCDQVVEMVKASSLHYYLKENAFSIQIQIRKKFIDGKEPSDDKNSADNSLETVIEHYEEKLKSMSTQFENQKKELLDVSKELHQAKIELHKQHQEDKEMKDEIITLKKGSKTAKGEKEKLKKELDLAKAEFALREKEILEQLDEAKNIVKTRDIKIDNLIKNNRCLNKEITKVKKESFSYCSPGNCSPSQLPMDNSSSMFASTSLICSNSSTESKTIDTFSKTSSVSCQTDPPEIPCHAKASQTQSHPDIPYNISAPLPPIFSSQLCYSSKRIQHISSSLPKLSTLGWVRVTEDDILRDKAEQALSDQYDRQIEDYYLEEKEKSKAIREIYEEDLIRKLYEET